MEHVVVLALAAQVDGELRWYVFDDRAEEAIDAFGHAEAVERVEDERGVRYRVTCAQQRGERGAFAMHAIACAYRVPVHVE